jgi:hypothetical protein
MKTARAYAATELLAELLIQATRISQALQVAHNAGRDLTSQEWTEIEIANDGARRRLEAAILAARQSED